MSGATHSKPGTSADEQPTIVHITHWKAGSQWLYHILHQCCADRIITPEEGGEHFLKGEVLVGGIYPTVYLPRQVVERVRVPADTRFFVVLRDPRDTLISLYYSQKISHVLDKNFTLEARRQLQSVGKEEGLLALMAGARMQDVLDIHTSWTDSDATVLSYESLVERDEELLVPLLTEICPLGVSEDVVRAVIRRNRFEEVSGRARGVENVLSHLRSGRPGEWRRHFSPRVADAFEKRFGDALRRLNYVRDGSWVDEAEARPAASLTDASASPVLRSFSVIFTLPQDQGHALSAVRSWTRSMQYPNENYELIVVSDGASPQLDAEISRNLRPRDRMVVVAGANRSVLLNRGVGAASHGWLVFTEAHVEAEPDFLKELHAWLSIHSDVAAVCCRTMATFENHLAYWDGRLNDEDVARQRDGNAWWNINIHAFSMTRESFHKGGGLDESYDLFSVILLASRLRGMGDAVGYAPGPAVLHHYRPGLGVVERQARSFVRDEYRYREAHPGPDRLGFSALPAISLPSGNPAQWRALWPSAWRNAGLGRPGLLLALIRRSLRRMVPSAHWARTATARQLAWSRLGCLIWRNHRARLEPHYRNFRRLIVVDELQSLMDADSIRRARVLKVEPGVALPASGLDGAVAGLHSDESHGGVWFRWADPLSVWALGRIAGGGVIELGLLPVRRELRATDVQVYWNGVRLAGPAIQYRPEALVVSLPEGGALVDANTLVILVPPVQLSRAARRNESRSLGLAITTVQVR